MSHRIFTHDALPAVIIEFGADYDAATENQSVTESLNQTLNETGPGQYAIFDWRQAHFSMDDLIQGAGSALGDPTDGMRNPKIVGIAFIGDLDMWRMIANNLNGMSGGDVAHIEAFETMEDALAHIERSLSTE